MGSHQLSGSSVLADGVLEVCQGKGCQHREFRMGVGGGGGVMIGVKLSFYPHCTM